MNLVASAAWRCYCRSDALGDPSAAELQLYAKWLNEKTQEEEHKVATDTLSLKFVKILNTAAHATRFLITASLK